MVAEWVRPVGMVGRCTLVGAVNGDWFVADSGEACTCVIDGGAGEGVGGAQMDLAVWG